MSGEVIDAARKAVSDGLSLGIGWFWCGDSDVLARARFDATVTTTTGSRVVSYPLLSGYVPAALPPLKPKSDPIFGAWLAEVEEGLSPSDVASLMWNCMEVSVELSDDAPDMVPEYLCHAEDSAVDQVLSYAMATA